MIAAPRHGAGHRPPGRDEIFAVVDAALEAGVARHRRSPTPSSPRRDLTIEDQIELGAAGRAARALLHDAAHGQGRRGSWIDEHPRDVGPENSVLSTDLGQVFNPPVEDGMALMVDRLLEAGFSEEEVHVMAVVEHPPRRGSGAV